MKEGICRACLARAEVDASVDSYECEHGASDEDNRAYAESRVRSFMAVPANADAAARMGLSRVTAERDRWELEARRCSLLLNRR